MLKHYYNLLLLICKLSNLNFFIHGEIGGFLFYTGMFFFYFPYILKICILVVTFSRNVLIVLRSHTNNIRYSIFLNMP